MAVNNLKNAGLSFPLSCLIGKVTDEDEEGINCSLGSIAKGFPVLDDASA